MFKFGFKKKPVNQNNFVIPVLIKRREFKHNIYSSSSAHVDQYYEAFTDNFYYEKDCKRYYRVKENDKEFYMKEDQLVFLTDAN